MKCAYSINISTNQRLTRRAAQAVQTDALARGAWRLPGGVGALWNAAGDCARPGLVVKYVPGSLDVTTRIYVRCRRCWRCGAHRGNEWASRNLYELEVCERAWLVTLTFGPTVREILRGLATDDQSDVSLIRANYTSRLVKEYCDRLRHRSPGIRYVAVCELHKDGFPHWHLLVVEGGMATTRHRHLTGAWVHGFSNARIARDGSAATYVSKYVAKSLVRVRASRRWGRPGPEVVDASRSTAPDGASPLGAGVPSGQDTSSTEFENQNQPKVWIKKNEVRIPIDVIGELEHAVVGDLLRDPQAAASSFILDVLQFATEKIWPGRVISLTVGRREPADAEPGISSEIPSGYLRPSRE